MTKSARILVLGLDGAEKDLILSWAADGSLPALRGLMETGQWWTVENPPGLFAGSVWPSFFTGVSPGRHGKYCSNQLILGTYDVGRVQGFDGRYETIWDALGRRGKISVVIDPPKCSITSNPVGIQVMDWAAEDFEIDLQTWPWELSSEIRKKYGKNPVVESEVDVQSAESLRLLRDSLLARVDTKTNLTKDMLAREDWGFAFSLFTEVHTAGHLCWHLHDPDHPLFDESLRADVGDIVRDTYIATDNAIGKLIEDADTETHVFVYSINGMGACYTGSHLIDEALYAYQRNSLPRFRCASSKVADWIDAKVPGAIYDALYPFQRFGRRALGLSIRDPRYRKYYRVPTNAIVGGIRINLVDREPCGLVPRESYEAVCDEIHMILSEIINLDTGNPISEKIIKTKEVFDGDHVEELPDLIVQWSQEAPISRVYSNRIGVIEKQYNGDRTGDHRPYGMLMYLDQLTRGGGDGETISIYDLAPTLTDLAGTHLQECDGQSLLRQPEFSHRLSTRSIT